MKIRKLFSAAANALKSPAPPVPPIAGESEEAEYAKAIAQTVLQGMPGEQFAIAVNIMKPDAVKLASTYTLDECLAWFKRDHDACRILEATPGFEKFATAFHAKACEMYPGIKL